MINFVDLVGGNTFIHEDKRYMRLAQEVCNFHSLGGNFNLRLKPKYFKCLPKSLKLPIIKQRLCLNFLFFIQDLKIISDEILLGSPIIMAIGLFIQRILY